MNSVQKPTVSSSNYPDSPSPLVVIPKNPHSLLPDSLFVKLSARYLIKLFPLPNTRSVKGPPTAVLKINERKESHLVPKISVLPFPFHWSVAKFTPSIPLSPLLSSLPLSAPPSVSLTSPAQTGLWGPAPESLHCLLSCCLR